MKFSAIAGNGPGIQDCMAFFRGFKIKKCNWPGQVLGFWVVENKIAIEIGKCKGGRHHVERGSKTSFKRVQSMEVIMLEWEQATSEPGMPENKKASYLYSFGWALIFQTGYYMFLSRRKRYLRFDKMCRIDEGMNFMSRDFMLLLCSIFFIKESNQGNCLWRSLQTPHRDNRTQMQTAFSPF